MRLPHWIALLAAAAALRALRALARWDEVAWLYAAYNAPTVRALAEGRWTEALTTFTGLHPPAGPLLHALIELSWPAPAAFLAASALASLAAVALWRRQPLAAALLASSPLQLEYAAELNNHPLLALSVSLTLAALARDQARSGWLAVALAGALGAWVHGLAGLVGGLAALCLGGRRAAAALALMALACLPLLPQVLALAAEPSTYAQPEPQPWLTLADAAARLGGLGLLWLPAAALGARRLPRLAALTLGALAFILALHALGVTAPHQLSYFLALGPPLALLAEAGAGPRLRAALFAVALLQGLWVGAFNAQRLAWTLPGEPAMAEALARARPGEAVYLLSPAPLNDDDKRLTSPALHSVGLLAPLPLAQPYPLRHEDFRHGQPRRRGEITLYVNDQLHDALDLALAAHPRLHLVLAPADADLGLTRALDARFGPGEPLGAGLLRTLPRARTEP